MPATATAPAPTINVPMFDHSYDPNAGSNAPVGDQNHIRQQSESLVVLEDGYNKTMQNAATLNERWEERNKREGTKVFLCPFCQNSVEYATKKDAKAHMKKEHEMRLYELRMTKAPKQMSEPTERHKSPKRTYADLTSPQQAAIHQAMKEANPALIPVQGRANKLANKLSPGILMALPESLAKQRVSELDKADLQEAYRMAVTRSRREVAKVLKDRMDREGVDTSLIATNSGRMATGPFVQRSYADQVVQRPQILGPNGQPFEQATIPVVQASAPRPAAAKRRPATKKKAVAKKTSKSRRK